MNIDFTKIDKSNFECIKLNDEDIYFGLTKLMHCETMEFKDNLDDIEEEEEKEKYTKVRHGVGI